MTTLEEFVRRYNQLVRETGYQIIAHTEEVKVGAVMLRLSQELRVERVNTNPQVNGVKPDATVENIDG